MTDEAEPLDMEEEIAGYSDEAKTMLVMMSHIMTTVRMVFVLHACLWILLAIIALVLFLGG